LPGRLVNVEFDRAVDLKRFCSVGLSEVRVMFQLALGD
jgi:hypothetical protein